MSRFFMLYFQIFTLIETKHLNNCKLLYCNNKYRNKGFPTLNIIIKWNYLRQNFNRSVVMRGKNEQPKQVH